MKKEDPEAREPQKEQPGGMEIKQGFHIRPTTENTLSLTNFFFCLEISITGFESLIYTSKKI